jgi:hypothetical protein
MDGPVPTRARSGFAALAVKAALLLTAALPLGSCGTILTFAGGFEETDSALSPKPFGGVRLDVRGVSTFAEKDLPWSLAVAAFVIDVPLSVAADVLTLPVTIPLHLCRPAAPGSPSDPDTDEASGADRPRS